MTDLTININSQHMQHDIVMNKSTGGHVSNYEVKLV